MKRIKCDEIQNSIQNYLKQRNLSSSLVSTNITSDKNKNPIYRKDLTDLNSSIIDLNLMALNDLTLIESSINDYYTFSLSSPSQSDYFKQFEM